jgi:Ca2+-binding RTX toxin-like protein
MLRKLLFRRDRNRNSQTGRKLARRGKSLRHAILGVERLELRELLATMLDLQIPEGQFFEVGSTAVPFRASFCAVAEALTENFSYSIDWGDPEPPSTDSTGTTGDLSETIVHMIDDPTAPAPFVGAPLVGRIQKGHPYLNPGVYPVTVTLSDGPGGSPDLVSDPVDVFVRATDSDFNIEILSTHNQEGVDVELALTDFLGTIGSNANDAWIINWGDGNIQTFAGTSETVTHKYDDRDFNVSNAEYVISAQASRDNGATFKYANRTSIQIFDEDMDIEIDCPSEVSVGETFELTLFAEDFDAVHSWAVTWFDLTGGQTLSGEDTSVSHAYDVPGSYLILVQVTNDDGWTVETFVPVTVTGLTQGTTLDENGTLFINGSTTGTGNDTAFISVSGGNITVNASVNGTNPFVALLSDVDAIVVDLGSGNDILVTAPGINVPMTITGGDGNDLITAGGGADFIDGGLGVDILYGAGGDDVLLGGDGNDDLFGGSGNDVLIGGNGNDMLFGQAGRDLLIGSSDEDLLSAGDGEDILVGGSTDYDSYDISGKANIDAIMAEWTSTSSFNTRVSNLAAYLNASTITDDDSTDIIMGGSGRDLVFGDNNPGDGVTDLLALTPLQDVLVAITT